MERTRELIKSLGEFGFDDSVNFNAAVFDVETLSMIRLVIRDNFTRTKIIRDLDLTQSYPLKHKIENYFRGNPCHPERSDEGAKSKDPFPIKSGFFDSLRSLRMTP